MASRGRSEMEKWEREMEVRQDVEALERVGAMRKNRNRLNRALEEVRKNRDKLASVEETVDTMGLRRKGSPTRRKQRTTDPV